MHHEECRDQLSSIANILFHNPLGRGSCIPDDQLHIKQLGSQKSMHAHATFSKNASVVSGYITRFGYCWHADILLELSYRPLRFFFTLLFCRSFIMLVLLPGYRACVVLQELLQHSLCKFCKICKYLHSSVAWQFYSLLYLANTLYAP